MQHIANSPKSGFTLIEMIVASLLMGMLVTILTMVFNQSSIAWRTGKATITDLDTTRRDLAQMQYRSEDALPRVKVNNTSTAYKVPTLWQNGFTIRSGRNMETVSGVDATKPFEPDKTISASASSGSAKTYIVGVFSAGPDGKWDTNDDISSMPEKKK